jgi:hypothetical protein
MTFVGPGEEIQAAVAAHFALFGAKFEKHHETKHPIIYSAEVT